MRAKARADAREIVSEAHVVAREVLREGTELSRNLRELSVSLHNNAERLIRDVRLAHGGLTARLDQAGPGSPRREDDLRLLGRRGRGMTRETTSTCRSSSRRGERGLGGSVVGGSIRPMCCKIGSVRSQNWHKRRT